MSFSTSCVFYFLCESLAIVTREHGDLFLTTCVLFWGCSRPYDESSSIPITGWIAILKLSTLWNAPALRKAAIGKIDSELETWKATNNAEESSKFPAVLLPSNLVLLGREYSVDKWILHGYRSLVNTDKRMSELDAQTIGWKQAYQVMLLKEEQYKEQVLWGGSGLVADSRIRDTFQLEIPVLAPTLCERESIPARKKRRG